MIATFAGLLMMLGLVVVGSLVWDKGGLWRWLALGLVGVALSLWWVIL